MSQTDLTKDFVAAQAAEIRRLIARSSQDIIEIGTRLIAVKERLDHGQFGPWLEHEFAWSYPTAARFMQAAKAFGKTSHGERFEATALYALASGTVPETVREHFIVKAEAGKRITHQMVRAAIGEAKAAAQTPVRSSDAEVGQTVAGILALGQRVLARRAELPDGLFAQWVSDELAWPRSVADWYAAIAEEYAGGPPHGGEATRLMEAYLDFPEAQHAYSGEPFWWPVRTWPVTRLRTRPPFSTFWSQVTESDEDELVEQIAASMRRWGVFTPLLVWRGHDVVVDGHLRLRAAALAGLREVPVQERYFASESAALDQLLAISKTRKNYTEAELADLDATTRRIEVA